MSSDDPKYFAYWQNCWLVVENFELVDVEVVEVADLQQKEVDGDQDWVGLEYQTTMKLEPEVRKRAQTQTLSFVDFDK